MKLRRSAVVCLVVAMLFLANTAIGEPPEKRWFVMAGATNYHTRLEEAEDNVDQRLNAPFSAMFPDWEEPETVMDWSDHWKLWDGWLGVGRDINEKWYWFVSAGAGKGTIKNSDTYQSVPAPAHVSIDFKRTEAYVEAGVTWFPFGKPALLSEDEASSRMARSLRGTRPFLEAAAGYDHKTTQVDVEVVQPPLGLVIDEQETDRFDVLHISPRGGVEMPLTENNSLGVTGGYVFYSEHASEFDSWMLGVFLRHRF